MWLDLFSAVALVLVFEGLLPFLTPDGYRRAVQAMMQMNNRQLRIMGLLSMLSGLFFLYLIRN